MLTVRILEIMTKWVELWGLVLMVFGICYRYMLITVNLGIKSNFTEGKINVSHGNNVGYFHSVSIYTPLITF